MEEKVNAIIAILKERYGSAPCALHYGKDYELMISVRLRRKGRGTASITSQISRPKGVRR